jgi:putative restriction endonuclease
VLCTPRDSQKTGKRNIESFESGSLLQFGPLVKQGAYSFATIASSVPIVKLARRWNTTESLQADVEAILATSVPATTKESLLAGRLGQGRFRKQVLKAWGGQCCVTGSRTLDAIRASHIKPWNKSDDQERLDPSNGLPLIATLDALFPCLMPG